jgi:hypothetical protein
MRDGDYLDDLPSCVPTSRVQSRRSFIVAGASLLALPAIAHASPSRNSSVEHGNSQQDVKPLLRRLRKRTVSDDMILAVAEALARSGIGTYVSPVDVEPMVAISGTPSPLKYLRWQVTTMANELAARNGSTGAELDALIDPFESGVSPFAIIAGYVHDVKSTGADLVRGLVGKRDWKHRDFRIPMLVRAIVAGDVLAALAKSPSIGRGSLAYRGTNPFGSEATSVDYQSTTLCQQITLFVTTLLAGVATTLQFGSDPALHSDFFTALWAGMISIGAAARTGLTDLTQANIAEMISVATIYILETQIIGLIHPWTVRVTPDPSRTRFGVGTEEVHGSITVDVTAGADGDWPEDLRACAADAGIALPSVDDATAHSRWNIHESPVDLIHGISVFADIDAGATATRTCLYVTNQESSDVARLQEQEGVVDVTVSIVRDDLEELDRRLTVATFPDLHGFIGDTFGPIMGAGYADLMDRLIALKTATGTTSITVIYHDGAIEVPDDSGTGCEYGDWNLDDLVAAIQAMFDSIESEVQFTYSFAGGGSVLHIRSDDTFRWNFNQYAIDARSDDPDIGTMIVSIVFDGTFEGVLHAQDNQLLIESRNHTLTVSAEAYLNGAFVTDMPVESEAWWSPGGALSFKCGPDADTMTLVPKLLDDPQGIIVRRVGT